MPLIEFGAFSEFAEGWFGVKQPGHIYFINNPTPTGSLEDDFLCIPEIFKFGNNNEQKWELFSLVPLGGKDKI